MMLSGYVIAKVIQMAESVGAEDGGDESDEFMRMAVIGVLAKLKCKRGKLRGQQTTAGTRKSSAN